MRIEPKTRSPVGGLSFFSLEKKKGKEKKEKKENEGQQKKMRKERG